MKTELKNDAKNNFRKYFFQLMKNLVLINYYANVKKKKKNVRTKLSHKNTSFTRKVSSANKKNVDTHK